jgi:hypothetical protein
MLKKDKKTDERKENRDKNMWVKKSGGNGGSFMLLIIIVLVLSLILQTMRGMQKYNDTDIAISELEQNYLDWIYSEILVDRNKAFATHSGETIIERW